MIVIVNVESQRLELYAKRGVQFFPFAAVEDFLDTVGNNPVLYVTAAVESTGPEIVQTLRSMGIGLDALTTSGDGSLQSTGSDWFLHSVQKGPLHIPLGKDENGKDMSLIFKGPGDCKVLDEDMKALIGESFILRELIKQKKVLVLNAADMRKVVKSAKGHAALRAQQKALREEGREDIIVDSATPGSAARIAARGIGDDEGDAVFVDMTSELKEGEKETEDDTPPPKKGDPGYERWLEDRLKSI